MPFLVVQKTHHTMPPEAALPLMKAMHEWLKRYRQNGKIEQTWNFAGQAAGGGIISVESHEELDDILAENPIRPFTSVDVYPLTDIDRSFEKQIQVIEHMMQMMPAH